MITKERLEELIKQGATIYGVDYGRILMADIVEIKTKDMRYNASHNNFQYIYTESGDCYLYEFYEENLFETKAEAEWQAEFGCIETTIKLELPKFEDFREPISFMGQDNIKYWITKWQDCIGIVGSDSIFRLICDYTKENYIEACRKAKELFLQGAER